jgi:hypothetical protein
MVYFCNVSASSVNTMFSCIVKSYCVNAASTAVVSTRSSVVGSAVRLKAALYGITTPGQAKTMLTALMRQGHFDSLPAHVQNKLKAMSDAEIAAASAAVADAH